MGNKIREPGLHHAVLANTLNELKSLRDKHDISDAEWARRSGFSDSIVSRVSDGTVNLTVYSLCKLASGLGLKPKIVFVDLDEDDVTYAEQPKRPRPSREVGGRVSNKPKVPKKAEYAPSIKKVDPVPEPEIEEKPRVNPNPVANGTAFVINPQRKAGKTVAAFSAADTDDAVAEFLRRQAENA